MARTRTLANLRSDVRYLADIQGNSDWQTDSQLTRLINEGIAEYRRTFLVHFLTTSTSELTGGTATLSLPADFDSVHRVEIDIGNGSKYVLHSYESPEAQDFSAGFLMNASLPVAYRIEGSTLTFIPTPDDNYSVTLVYLPHLTDLSADSDTFNPRIDGGESWVVIWVCRRIAIRDMNPRLSMLDAEFARVSRELERRGNPNPGPVRRIDTRSRNRALDTVSRLKWWMV